MFVTFEFCQIGMPWMPWSWLVHWGLGHSLLATCQWHKDRPKLKPEIYQTPPSKAKRSKQIKEIQGDPSAICTKVPTWKTSLEHSQQLVAEASQLVPRWAVDHRISSATAAKGTSRERSAERCDPDGAKKCQEAKIQAVTCCYHLAFCWDSHAFTAMVFSILYLEVANACKCCIIGSQTVQRWWKMMKVHLD